MVFVPQQMTVDPCNEHHSKKMLGLPVARWKAVWNPRSVAVGGTAAPVSRNTTTGPVFDSMIQPAGGTTEEMLAPEVRTVTRKPVIGDAGVCRLIKPRSKVQSPGRVRSNRESHRCAVAHARTSVSQQITPEPSELHQRIDVLLPFGSGVNTSRKPDMEALGAIACVLVSKTIFCAVWVLTVHPVGNPVERRLAPGVRTVT